MLGNPQLEFKSVDAHTIEVEAKEITDEHIYKLEAIIYIFKLENLGQPN